MTYYFEIIYGKYPFESEKVDSTLYYKSWLEIPSAAGMYICPPRSW